MKKVFLSVTISIIFFLFFFKTSFADVGCRLNGDLIYSKVKNTTTRVYFNDEIKNINYSGSFGCGPINVTNFIPYTSCTNESNLSGGYLVNYDEPTPCPIDSHTWFLVLFSSSVFFFSIRKNWIYSKKGNQIIK